MQNSQGTKKNQSSIEHAVASMIINLSMKYETWKLCCDFSAK
jgi:hypothetical protein